jgi:hypothetical protein
MKKVTTQLWAFLWMASFFLFYSITSFCQKAPMKFGEVDIKDVSMKTFDKDPSAEAVVLAEYGETSVEIIGDKFKVVYERHFRYKILKKEGLDRANIKIYAFNKGSDRERVSSLKGYTYNLENGVVQKTKLEKENIFETQLDKNRWQTSFSFPNVKEGSVIEYSYTLISDFIFSLDPWVFQNNIPTLWSEYRITVPEYLEYTQVGTLTFPLFVNEKISHSGTYRWVMKDLPAFKDEKYITSVRDYFNIIDFQLAATNFPNQGRKPILSDWTKFIEELLKDERYGGYMNKRGAYKEIVSQLIAGKTSPKDKMNAIFEYVKNNIQYNDDDGIFSEKSTKEVIEKKSGGSPEINLLLTAMLKEADLEAYPVLLSTRSHGVILNTLIPIMSKFNYNIVYVKIGQEEFLLDATDPMYPVNMVAYEALNKYGIAIVPDGKQFWVNLQDTKNSKSSSTIIGNLTIDKEGLVAGTINTQHKGYEAFRIRKKIIKAEKDIKSVSEDDKEMKDLNYKNVKEFGKPLESSKTVKTTDFAQVNGDIIYLTPILDFKQKENPFKQETRQFPVDFAYGSEEYLIMNYTIPEGYIIEELPKSTRFQWGDGTVKFDYFVKGDGNRIQVMSKITINKSLFPVEEYKDLRNLFSQIVSKHEEQIVLKKK